VFDTCWSEFEKCFLSETCWTLFFGGKEGYGLDYIFKAITGYELDNNETKDGIPPMPTTVDNRIRQYYCNDKGDECDEVFWQVWYCVWDPIYLGATYGACEGKTNQYWNDDQDGCGLAVYVYKTTIPSCIVDNCMGFADDCLSDSSSSCYKTMVNAINNDEWSMCAFCQDTQYNCGDDCVTSSDFRKYYETRCSSSGEKCSEEYANLANCAYQQCGKQTDILPGATEYSDCATSTKGAITQSCVLALILSVVVAKLSL
jgi:hypothetical protein